MFMVFEAFVYEIVLFIMVIVLFGFELVGRIESKGDKSF